MSPKKTSGVITAIVVILSLESLALWVVTGWLVVDTVTLPSTSIGGAVFLDVLVALSAAASTWAAWAFWRGNGHTRSAIVVWQMLLIGIGIASAQGPEPRWDIALALIVPATLVTIFVLFRREVSRHLGKDA
jgi:hypothetical protein